MSFRVAAVSALAFSAPAHAGVTCDDLRRAVELHQAGHMAVTRAAEAMNLVIGEQMSDRALSLAASEALLVRGSAPLAEAVVASLSHLEEATALYVEACAP